MTCPGLVDDGRGRDCIVSSKWRANYTTIVTVDIEGVIQYRKDFPNNFSNAYSGLDSKIEDLLADIDTIPPTVTVQSPSSNDVLDQGTTTDITWTANDNIDVKSRAIHFSSDDGSNWSLVDSSQTNTGTYSWTVPNSSSSICLIEVHAYDEMGNDGIGQSSNFSISGTSITNNLAGVVNNISYKKINGDLHLTIPVRVSHTFQIFDLAGRNIITKDESTSQQYNISKLVPAGTYIIRLISKSIHHATPIVIIE